MSLCIGDIADVFNGKTPSKAEQRQAGFPVLKIKDVDALGQFRGAMESFVDQSFADAFRTKHLQVGDTLILNAAHNADYVASKTFFAREAYGHPLVTGEWTVVRPRALKTEPAYVRHYIESPQAKKQLKEAVSGIHLYPKDVARLPIPVPSLPEQRRIAAILDKADVLRTRRREAIAKLDQLLQSVFIEMFGDPVTNPKGWPSTTIGDLASFITSGSRGWAKFYSDSGAKFIRIQNLVDGDLDMSDCAYVDAPDSAESRRTLVREGDVLVSITADLGRTAVVPSGLGAAHINQHIAILRLSGVNPSYVSHFLASLGGRIQFERLNRAAVKAGLNFDDLRSLKILVPSTNLQDQYLSTLDAIKRMKRRLNAQQTSFDGLFSSLQQRAFSAAA